MHFRAKTLFNSEGNAEFLLYYFFVNEMMFFT